MAGYKLNVGFAQGPAVLQAHPGRYGILRPFPNYKSTGGVTQFPLVEPQNLNYLGSFRVPYTAGGGEFSFTASAPGTLTFNPPNGSNGPNGSLFLGGHASNNYSQMAEIEIPSNADNTLNIGNGYNLALSSLPQATTYVQNFADVVNGTLTTCDTANTGCILLGAQVYEGSLVVSGGAVYDVGAPAIVGTHWLRPTNLSITTQTTGPVPVGYAPNTTDLYTTAGPICDIPSSWQTDFGGPLLACASMPGGEWNLGGVSGWQLHPAGPCAAVFDPSKIGAVSPVPATPVIKYGTNNQTGTGCLGGVYITDGPYNDYITNDDTAGAVCFPDNYGSLLFFGKHCFHYKTGSYGRGVTTDYWDGGPISMQFTGSVNPTSNPNQIFNIANQVGVYLGGSSANLTGPGIATGTTTSNYSSSGGTMTISLNSTSTTSGTYLNKNTALDFAYDPLKNTTEGEHGYPYAPWVWAFKATDLLAVKNGSSASAVMPHAVFELKIPYFSFAQPGYGIMGATIDRTTGRIYIAQGFPDSQSSGNYPLIHVFNLIPSNAIYIAYQTTLNSGRVGTAYTATLRAYGGSGSYTWSITSGALPSWATLNSVNGEISGTPTASGTTTFTVTATDTNGATASSTLNLLVIGAQAFP